MDQIKESYRNPKVGLKGLSEFSASHRRFDPREIEEALISIPSYSLNRPIKHHFPTRKTVVPEAHDQFQIDLADVSNIAEENDGITFLFCAIDCFSRKAYVYPLKNKKAESVAQALLKLLNETHFRNLQSDDGTEFKNRIVQKILKDHNINFFTVRGSNSKAAIVERFIRTLRGRMSRLFDSINSFRYIDYLDDLIENYNNTKHRSIGMSPNSFTESDTAAVFKKLYQKYYEQPQKPPKFSEGDYVRIPSAHSTFSKEGLRHNWAVEVFKISSVKPSQPTTYHLEDLLGEPIDGVFYEQELNLTVKPEKFFIEKILEKKKRGKKVFYKVRWVGYPPKFDSYEPEEEIPPDLRF